MRRTCEACGEEYDDVYRLTYCPHDQFEMNALVCGMDGVAGVAHTLEDLRRMLEEAER